MDTSLHGVEQHQMDVSLHGVEQDFSPAAKIALYLCHSDRARRPRSFATGEPEREWRNPGNLSTKRAASGSPLETVWHSRPRTVQIEKYLGLKFTRTSVPLGTLENSPAWPKARTARCKG
jgi:hypothetical protein